MAGELLGQQMRMFMTTRASIIRAEPLSKGKKSKAREFSNRLSILTVLQGGRAWWVLQEEGYSHWAAVILGWAGRKSHTFYHLKAERFCNELQGASAVDKAGVALGLQLVKQNPMACRF